MDPTTLMFMGGLVNAGAGAIAQWIAGGESDEEKKARRQQLAEYSALAAPEHRDIIAQGVKESAFSRVRGNQGLQANQDEVQARLMSRGRGEQSAASRAAQEEARMSAARTAQGDREAILAEGRARGTVGSGEELLLQQDANQSAAETERMAGLRALADADEQALQALIAGGSLAGQREERDLSRQSQEAGALDDIALFNAGQTNSLAVANAQLRNAAFQNRLSLADRRADIYGQQANRAQQGRQGTAAAIGGVGQGVGYGLAAYGQYAANKPPSTGGAPKPTMGTPVEGRPPNARAATPYERANPAAIGTGAALPQKTRRLR